MPANLAALTERGNARAEMLRAGDDLVEHCVERPEAFAHVVVDRAAANRVERADALVIDLRKRGVTERFGYGGEHEKRRELLRESRVLCRVIAQPVVQIRVEVREYAVKACGAGLHGVPRDGRVGVQDLQRRAL